MRKLTLSALFTALTAVLAQVAIPLPFSPVPFTGQLIGVMLAAALLGSKAGALAMAAYLMLGAAGAPVFSMGRGGIYMLTGPTGGYLWGFLGGVYLAGLIIEKAREPGFLHYAAAMLSLIAITYSCGALQLALIMRYSAWQALLLGVFPFLPFDLIKAVIVIMVAGRVRKSLEQNNLGHIFKS